MNTNENTFSALVGQSIPPLFEMSGGWLEALCEIEARDDAPDFYGLSWPGRDACEEFPLHDEIMSRLEFLNLDLDEAVGSVFTYRPDVAIDIASHLALDIELDLDGALIVTSASRGFGKSVGPELTIGLSRSAAALSMYRSLKAHGVLNPPMPLGVSAERVSEVINSAANALRGHIAVTDSLIDDIDRITSISIAA